MRKRRDDVIPDIHFYVENKKEQMNWLISWVQIIEESLIG